MTDLCR